MFLYVLEDLVWINLIFLKFFSVIGKYSKKFYRYGNKIVIKVEVFKWVE